MILSEVKGRNEGAEGSRARSPEVVFSRPSHCDAIAGRLRDQPGSDEI